MHGYIEWLILYRITDPVDTPSWRIGGMNKKWWDEGYKRGEQGLLANPRSEASKMGYEAGCKNRELIKLLRGDV